ncbi:2-oxoglutarate dehydrogenase E1 component [Vibrio astriarenae]|nr:2-oxoglutarate dehydrogenase E1 component [Vibrio sp. C7]
MARVFTLAGANATYVEDLYELYLSDPDLVSEEWKRVFEELPALKEEANEQPHSRVRDYFRRLAQETKHYNVQVSDPDVDAKQVKVLQLINAYRFRGHEAAALDPLGLWQRPPVAELDPAFHSLNEDDLEETFNVGSFAIGQETMKLRDIYSALKKTYCGSIGAEYMHMTDTEQKRWIQQRLESVVGQPSFDLDEKRTFLEELTAAEGLERYLGAKFPGAKRFSLEGGDALIPMTKDSFAMLVNQACVRLLSVWPTVVV